MDCLWNSPGKNTGMGCHCLFQGIFLTQGLNPCLLLSRWILNCWDDIPIHLVIWPKAAFPISWKLHENTESIYFVLLFTRVPSLIHWLEHRSIQYLFLKWPNESNWNNYSPIIFLRFPAPKLLKYKTTEPTWFQEQTPFLLTIYYYLIVFFVGSKMVLKLLDSTCFFTFAIPCSVSYNEEKCISVTLLFFCLSAELNFL